MTLFDHMQPSPDTGPQTGNLPPFTVSDLSQALKRTVESAFGLVRVRGEVAAPKLHSSGHLYFTLKDDRAVLDAVCWRGKVSRIPFRLEPGMEVIATGTLTTYEKTSRYQINVERVELAGEGALLKMIEERRRRLEAEGLFAATRKRRIPHIPESIGIVTSPTGAVIHDILHRLAGRFPRPVLVWPVAVQGTGAGDQIAAAIRGFNALEDHHVIARPTILIVARGGGSAEDLACFSDEAVVRAVAESHIPVISAVGHETDTTLIDFAADLRAPTPTAAAEFAVPVRAELVQALDQASHRLRQAMRKHHAQQAAQLASVARGLGDPRRAVLGAGQWLDDRAERLGVAIEALLRNHRLHVARAGASLPHPCERLAAMRHRAQVSGHALRQAARARIMSASGRLAALVVPSPRQAVAHARQRLAHLAERETLSRRRALAESRRRFVALAVRLDPAPLLRLVHQWEYTLENRVRFLESLSYERVLERGFALVRDANGHVVTNGAALAEGQTLDIAFAEGGAKVVVR